MLYLLKNFKNQNLNKIESFTLSIILSNYSKYIKYILCFINAQWPKFKIYLQPV